MARHRIRKKKQKGKIFDKTMMTSTAIIVAVTLVVVLAVVLPDPIAALTQLNKAKDFVQSAPVEKLPVTAPVQIEGEANEKNYILSDTEAADMAGKVKELLENSEYSRTYGLPSTGVWLVNIVLYNSTEDYKIYLDEESFYITGKNRLIRYTPKSGHEEKYDEFYKKLMEKFEDTEKSEQN